MTVVTTMTGAPGADVRVERVSKAYRPGLQVLTGVSLRAAPNELVAITGPTGSGKTTLLNLIAGFEAPDSGSIAVDGIAPHAAPDRAAFRRDVVGVVFQLHHLLPGVTAQMNVEIALIGAGVHATQRRERAAALLELVGVGARRDHLPAELSGGERACVALARALANEPRLLLADEPTAALDSAAGGRVLDLLDTTRARAGMTVIAVTHDAKLAERADRTVRIADARLEQTATGRALLGSPP